MCWLGQKFLPSPKSQNHKFKALKMLVKVIWKLGFDEKAFDHRPIGYLSFGQSRRRLGQVPAKDRLKKHFFQFLRNSGSVFSSEGVGGLVLQNISMPLQVRNDQDHPHFWSRLTTLRLVNCSLSMKDIFQVLGVARSLKAIGLVNCRDTFLSVIPG